MKLIDPFWRLNACFIKLNDWCTKSLEQLLKLNLLICKLKYTFECAFKFARNWMIWKSIWMELILNWLGKELSDLRAWELKFWLYFWYTWSSNPHFLKGALWLTFKLCCLKWDSCKTGEVWKGVFRAASPHTPFPRLVPPPPVLYAQLFSIRHCRP